MKSIARFIASNGLIPGSIIVSFDKGEFSETSGNLTLPNRKNIGWIIDGQHRMAGAKEAAEKGVDPELPIVAFLNAKTRKANRIVCDNQQGGAQCTCFALYRLIKAPSAQKDGERPHRRAYRRYHAQLRFRRDFAFSSTYCFYSTSE